MWPLESHFYIQSVNIKTTSVHLSATTLKPPMQHCAGAPHANKTALTLEGLNVMSGTGTLAVDPLGSRVGHLQIWLVPLHPTYLIGLRSGSTLWALCGTPPKQVWQCGMVHCPAEGGRCRQRVLLRCGEWVCNSIQVGDTC